MTRIQELAEQAKNSIPKDSLGVSEWIAAYNQKFAELIVRECAKQVDNYWDEFKNGYADKKILEHFGVEE